MALSNRSTCLMFPLPVHRSFPLHTFLYLGRQMSVLVFSTTDVPSRHRYRPLFWNHTEVEMSSSSVSVLKLSSEEIVERVRTGDEEGRLAAAREIRRLTKTSAKNRRHLTDAIEPLVSMLKSTHLESNEVALLALLNLAVKDERNKIKIVDAGALEPLIGFLQSSNSTLQEYATATVLTLTASSVNKPILSSTGTIPILLHILIDGNQQSKKDAVMALYNLSTLPESLDAILSLQPISTLVSMLKNYKKLSKTVEKCTALVESLMAFDEARNALTAEKGGVLSIVEVLEGGSLQAREHAVGALLAMCESDKCRFREVILNEGAIPGLLELTVLGTPKLQSKARKLLRLLRNSPYPRPQMEGDTLENIVSNIVSNIEGDDRGEKAKKMLAEMVQVSMEQSLRHLQQRALLCIPTDIPTTKGSSKLQSDLYINRNRI